MKKKNFKKILEAVFTALMLLSAFNAEASPVTDAMRGNAKFNVVAVVLIIIFAGIILFLFRLDRKISHLEKAEKSEE